MKSFILPFSFADFVAKSATGLLFEAGPGLDYAGSDAVSKVGILFHYDQDWAFLSQFPPNFWKRAFYWRWREGLLRASEMREKHPKRHASVIPDWVPEIRLSERGKTHIFTGIPGKGMYVGYNTMITTFEKPIKYKPGKMTGTDYGYRPLAQTSDDGPSIHEINPYDPADRSRYKDGHIGMDMSNPQRITPEFIRDLPDDDPIILGAMSKGWSVERTKEELKKEPPHSLAGMPTMKEKNATEMLGNWIRAMGLGILGQVKVGEKIPDPLTGGELGVVALESPKELSGYWPAAVGKEDGTKWTTEDGSAVSGRVIELKVPVVIRNLPDWKVITANGAEKTQKGGPTKMPVLLSTAVLPRFSMPEAQRKMFAARSGRQEGAQRDSGGAAGDIENLLKNWDLLSDTQKHYIQVNKMDQLTIAAYQADPQGFHARHPGNSASMNFTIGWTANKRTKGLKPHHLSKDQMQKVIEAYVPEDSTKLKESPKYPCVKPEDDPDDKYVAQEHINGCMGGGLQGEAYDGITQYMVNNLDYKRASGNRPNPRHGVLKMMESALNDLVDTCALLLAIRLNDPYMGVYDPELGLTSLDPDLINKPESARARRVTFARKFARELEQACLKDTAYGTRRTRKRLASMGMGMGYERSLSGGGDDGRSEEDVQDAGQARGARSYEEPDENSPDFNDEDIFDPDADNQGQRRTEERDRILQGQGVGREQRGWNVSNIDQVARAGWMVPAGFGKWADAFLRSKRNEIAQKASPEYALSVERAKNAMKRAPAIWGQLLAEKERELASSISDPRQRTEEAARQLAPNFREELVKRFPDLYGGLNSDQMQAALQTAREQHDRHSVSEDDTTPEEEEQVAEEGGIPKRDMNQLISLNIHFLQNLLNYGSGDMYGFGRSKGSDDPVIKVIADDFTTAELAKEVSTPGMLKNFIESDLKLGRKGANDYFVKLWIAISKEQNSALTEQEAITVAQQLGLSPTEVAPKAPKAPEQPTPVAQQKPEVRTAAKGIRDLLGYIYEPMQANEDPAQITEKIRSYLQGLTPQKKDLKQYFTEVMDRILQQPTHTKKDRIIIMLLGDFLDDDTQPKI